MIAGYDRFGAFTSSFSGKTAAKQTVASVLAGINEILYLLRTSGLILNFFPLFSPANPQRRRKLSADEQQHTTPVAFCWGR